MILTCISFPMVSTESRTDIGLEQRRVISVTRKAVSHYDLPSRRAGREAKRASS